MRTWMICRIFSAASIYPLLSHLVHKPPGSWGRTGYFSKKIFMHSHLHSPAWIEMVEEWKNRVWFKIRTHLPWMDSSPVTFLLGKTI